MLLHRYRNLDALLERTSIVCDTLGSLMLEVEFDLMSSRQSWAKWITDPDPLLDPQGFDPDPDPPFLIHLISMTIPIHKV